jgi:hypothetical protein
MAKIYAEKSVSKARDFLTKFSVGTADELFVRWQAMDKYLLVKYIDGNVKRTCDDGEFIDNGNDANIPVMPLFPGYDLRWRKNVAANDDGTLRSPSEQ